MSRRPACLLIYTVTSSSNMVLSSGFLLGGFLCFCSLYFLEGFFRAFGAKPVREDGIVLVLVIRLVAPVAFIVANSFTLCTDGAHAFACSCGNRLTSRRVFFLYCIVCPRKPVGIPLTALAPYSHACITNSMFRASNQVLIYLCAASKTFLPTCVMNRNRPSRPCRMSTHCHRPESPSTPCSYFWVVFPFSRHGEDIIVERRCYVLNADDPIVVRDGR